MRKFLRFIRRLVLALVILALLVCGAEWWATRHLGGRSTHYLVTGESNGYPAWHENQFFPCRFVIPRTAVPPPPVSATLDPEAQPLRICLLTDSSTIGIIGPAFSFGRQMEFLLQAHYPGRDIEVLHMTFDGANSHILREMARDLRALHPNAVVLLCGNDEIAGPYGPASTLGRFHHSSRIARLLVLFSRMRLSQICADFLARRAPDATDRRIWMSREPLMMKGWLPPNSPGIHTARRSYRKNISAILRMASHAAPTVIACTTPVNLRDCAPFSTTDLADGDLSQLNREVLRHAIASETNAPDAAARLYDGILARNPRHAEALYRAGLLALHRGLTTEALPLLRAACDHDALHLRADSTFNQILVECAADARVDLFDTEALLASLSPDGIPGVEFFFDHIHLNFAGHYHLATALIDRLQTLHALPPLPDDLPPPPDAAALADLLLYTPWGHEAALLATREEMLHPPFQNQISQPAAMEHLSAEIAQVEARRAALTPASIRTIYARRRALRPEDPWLASRAAWSFLEARDYDSAIEASTAALRHWPLRYDVRALLVLAHLLRHDPEAEVAAQLNAQRAADPSAAAAEDAFLAGLRQADREATTAQRAARSTLENTSETLKETINTALFNWALSLHISDPPPVASPYPVSLILAVRTAYDEFLLATQNLQTTSNALNEALTQLTPALAEQTNALRQCKKTEKDLQSARKKLEKARAGLSSNLNPLEASQQLADLIRQADAAQSKDLSARTTLQLVEQRVTAAQGIHSNALAAMTLADATYTQARRTHLGSIRNLRQAYLKARAAAAPSAATTPPDSPAPVLWGPDFPEALGQRLDAEELAAKAAAEATEAAHAALQTELDRRETLRRQQLDTLAQNIMSDELPTLLGPLPCPAPYDTLSALQLGRALLLQKAPALALPWQQDALRRDPDNADAALALAATLHQLSRTAEAITILQTTLERLPSNPVLWEELGTLQCLNREWEDASRSYAMAEQLAPYRYIRFLKWARALVQLREYVRARNQIQTYLEYVPQDTEALDLLATIQPRLPAADAGTSSAPAAAKPSLLDSLME